MKYFIIFTVISIAGTVGLVIKPEAEVPVQYIEFVKPLSINVNI